MNYSREPNIRLDRRRRHGAIASLLTAAFVTTLSLLVMLFVTSAPVEGQDDRSINDSISASRALVTDDLYRVTAAGPLSSLTLPLNVAPASSGNGSGPVVSFTTTTPLLKVKTKKNTYNTYFGVEEGGVGHFSITLEYAISQDVTLTVSVWNDWEKIKYIDPPTNQELTLTEGMHITIPAGKLGIPFTFDATDFTDDDEYTELVRKFVTQISFTLVGSPPVRVLDGDGYNRLSLRWLENDIPTLSLDFPASTNYDEVLEEGDSFNVVVGTDTEISNNWLKITADLVAYADGVALEWSRSSITIPAFETKTLVVVDVPPGSVAGLVGKEVVLGLENAIVKDTGRDREDVRVKATDTLILNAGKPRVSLNTDSLTLVEGESTTITVEVSGDISSVGTATLMLVVSDEKFKDDYRIDPPYITLADVKAGKTFEIGAVDDGANIDPGEAFTLMLSSSLPEEISIDSSDELTLEVVDNMVPYALLETDSLTLTEGESATITVRVGGDIDSVADETLKFVISDETLKDDYRIIPEEIILAQARDVVTFEIEAVDDEDYDPGESFVLELVPSSSSIQLSSNYQLAVDIEDNDPLPVLSFKVPPPAGKFWPEGDYQGVHLAIEIEEGETTPFEVILDRKSNRDVKFDLDIGYWYEYTGDTFMELSTGERMRIPYGGGSWTIPAGELSVPFIYDAGIFENDVYNIKLLARVSLAAPESSEVIVNNINIPQGYVPIRLLENDTPTLSLKFADIADDDGVLEEGDSFEVVVETTNLLDHNNLSIEANLVAYADGVELGWNIPSMRINRGERDDRITVRVPSGSVEELADKWVVLKLENTILRDSGSGRIFPLDVSTDTLTLNAGKPRVSLSTDSLTLVEGESTTITVEVSGDIRNTADETLKLVLSDNDFEDDYRVTPKEITLAGARAGDTFEIGAVRDTYVDLGETFTLRLSSSLSSEDIRIGIQSELTLEIIDNMAPYALFEVDSLTLVEGESATVTIKVGGDIDSVGIETLTLVVSDETLKDDYIVEPSYITLAQAREGYTFEIGAVDDQDYDPGESFVLELVPSSSTIQLSSDYQLGVSINDDDPMPVLSFNAHDPWGKFRPDGDKFGIHLAIEIVEGDTASFDVALDRKSNRDVTFDLDLNYWNGYTGNTLKELSTGEGVDVPYGGGRWTIPAGELRIPFTFSTEELDDEVYSVFEVNVLTRMSLTSPESSEVVVDNINIQGFVPFVPIRLMDDDIPTLSLEFADHADDDGILEEGDSFEIVVKTDTEINNGTLKIEANLKASADGVALDWGLPSVTIPAFETKTLVVVDVPPGSVAGLVGKEVVLGLENAIVKDTGRDLKDDRVKATDTLTLNTGKPRVSLSTDSLILVEGESATVTVEVVGSIIGVADETLTLIVSDEKFKDDYRVKPSYITLAQAREGYTFEIGAVDDQDYDPGESFVLELVPSSSTIQLSSDYQLGVSIDDDDPMPVLSFKVPPPAGKFWPDGDERGVRLAIEIEEGETTPFEVILDRKSNRDVKFNLDLNYWYEYTGDTFMELSTGESMRIPYGGGSWTIPAGELSVPFIYDAGIFENDVYNIRRLAHMSLAAPESSEVIVDNVNTNIFQGYVPIRLLENDTPTLSLKFADIADDDGVLEEGDGFEVVVETTNLLDHNNLRIEANLVAYADGVDLGWNIPSVRINRGERDDRITVHVPSGSVADLEDKWVVLELENTILKGSGHLSTFPLDVSTDPLTLNATLRASLIPDSRIFIEGRTATITVEAVGAVDSVATETLWLEVSDQTLKDEYRIRPEKVTLTEAKAGATFEIKAVRDTHIGPGETVKFKLSSSLSSEEIHIGSQKGEVTLDLIDNMDSYALLKIDSLTLTEGETATVTVEVGGNVDSVSIETLKFVISDEKLKDDYEFTREEITLAEVQAGGTFEIKAVDDTDYDPGEILVLELKPSSSNIQLIGDNRLVVGINDNDPQPVISINIPHPWGPIAPFGSIDIAKGDTARLEVTLDRKSNYDVPLSLRVHSHTGSGRNNDRIIFQEWSTGEGRDVPLGGYGVEEWTIPAGELSIPFTIGTDGYKHESGEFFIGNVCLRKSFRYPSGKYTVAPNSCFIPLRVVGNYERSASFNTDSLTLVEGESATVTISAWGDAEGASDLTLRSLNSDFRNDYEIRPAKVTFAEAKAGASFEILAVDDKNIEPDEIFALRLIALSGGVRTTPQNELTLEIIDKGIYASLSTNTLTLAEGEITTVRVKVDGDVSAVTDEKLTLVLSDEAFRGEYRVTPAEVSLTDAQDGVSFMIEAVDNDIYDSDRKFALELTSTLDTIRFVTSTQLAVTVLNDDTPPQLAFVGEGVYTGDGGAYLDVDEGDVREFAIELDRESDEKVSISVFLNDDTRAVTAEQLGDKRIPFIAPTRQPQNRGDEGWSPGIDILKPYWLTIPAGSREVRFTVNFEEFGDEHLSSLLKQDVVSLYFGIEDGSGAVADPTRSRLTIRRVEDDTPKVALRFNPDDPSITVMEDSNFEVWVELTGNKVNDNFDLEVTLTATVTAGAALDLKLSTVTSPSGATVTVDVIGDNLANGNRKIELELERVVLKDNTIPWFATEFELEAAAGLTLTVDVIDDEIPTVSLSTNTLTLYEGYTGTVMVELRGDLDSLIGTTLKFEPRPGGTAGVDDYVTPTITIGEEARGETQKIYAADIYASYGSGREASETVVLQLNPSAERINVLSDELRLNIFDDSPRASLSVEQLTLAESNGETVTVEVVLEGDLKSIAGETLGLVRLKDDGGIDYLAVEGEDYKSSVIEVSKSVVQAGRNTYTIELSVKDDNVYDPDERVKLGVGLKSSSSEVEFVSLNSFWLNIVDNDEMPTISFAGDSDELTVIEGEGVTLTVELDHPSGRRIAVYFDFDKDNSNEALGYGYDYDFNDLVQTDPIVLEAGETSAQFRFDTGLLDNDIYIFDDDDRAKYELGELEFKLFRRHKEDKYKESEVGAQLSRGTDKKLKIYIKDDELHPPTLILRSGEFDSSSRIEIMEGETFNVWVGLSHPYDEETDLYVQLGSSDDDWIMGEEIEISGKTAGTLYEFVVSSHLKDDTVYRPIPDVKLSFPDDGYVEFGNGGEDNLEVENEFVVSIVDNDIPTAKFVSTDNNDYPFVPEGDTVKIVVSLEGDRTVLPETYTLELKSDPEYALGVLEDNIEISTLRVTVARDATQAVFNVVTINNNRYDPGNQFAFSLASSPEIVMHTGDDIIIWPTDTYSDVPTISFVNAKTTRAFNLTETFSNDKDFVSVLEGAATTIGVKLSNPSIYDVNVNLLLTGPGEIDPSEYDTYTIIPRSVTIPAGETYTTITYDARVLENDDYDIPEHLATVDGREYRHLGNLELKDPLNEARTEPDGFVKVAAKTEGGHIPLVVMEDDEEPPTISFSNPETKKPFSPEHQYSFSGNTHLLRGDMDNGYLGVAKGETTTLGVTLSRPSRFTITVDLLLEDNSDRIRVDTRLGNIPSSAYDTYTLIPMSVTIAAGETHTTILYGTGVLKDFDDPLPSSSGLPGTIFGQARRNYRYLGDLEFSIPATQSGIVRVADWKEGGYLPLVVIDDEIEDGPPDP